MLATVTPTFFFTFTVVEIAVLLLSIIDFSRGFFSFCLAMTTEANAAAQTGTYSFYFVHSKNKEQ